MRNGYTTGTTACAAAVAACIVKHNKIMPESVEINLPGGQKAVLPVYMDENGIFAVKDAGDDIDVTHGMKIYADVVFSDSDEIVIKGGRGIGTVTKKGLQVPVGESAINPTPREMIRKHVAGFSKGATVTVWAPDGERIAKETFNEKIGIMGGISIIGSTGIVTPMSVDAIIETTKTEIDVAAAEGKTAICLAPGKIGEKHFTSVRPDVPVILMSNYAKEAFEHARKKGFENIWTAGHPGKLLKILMGHYNTHSKNSPMATDYLAERLCLKDNFNTVEEILGAENINLSFLAEELALKLEKDFGFSRVSVIFYDMKGGIKGERI